MEISKVSYIGANTPVSFGNLIQHRLLTKALENAGADSYTPSYPRAEKPQIMYSTVTRSLFERHGGVISDDWKTATIRMGFFKRKYTGTIDGRDKETGYGIIRNYARGKLISEQEFRKDEIIKRRYRDNGNLEVTYVNTKSPDRTYYSFPIVIETKYDINGQKTEERIYKPGKESDDDEIGYYCEVDGQRKGPYDLELTLLESGWLDRRDI